MNFPIPFGKTTKTLNVDDSRVLGILKSRLGELKPDIPERDIVKNAMQSPIGSEKLCDLARGKKKVTVITADHTRPVPSRVTLPLILEEIRRGNPAADITILIATGCHRDMTGAEMKNRFGEDVYAKEKFIMHDARDESRLRSIGTLPSGGDCIINTLVLDADLVVSEGFIEPHFFAGYSGGRKAVLPGSASLATVLANHCAEFVNSEKARCGMLDGNPIHADMIYAARTAGMAYIVNVILDAEKKIVAAVAGDTDQAHRAGCAIVDKYVKVKRTPADIVVTSNGGYPLDQNVYQSVKSMIAGEATVRKGGVIIVCSECSDGHGSEEFSNAFVGCACTRDVADKILRRGRNETVIDQWQTQTFCRILSHASVIMVTGPGASRELVEKMKMKWAPSLDDAMKMAEDIVGNPKASVVIVPDGVGVIVAD